MPRLSPTPPSTQAKTVPTAATSQHSSGRRWRGTLQPSSGGRAPAETRPNSAFWKPPFPTNRTSIPLPACQPAASPRAHRDTRGGGAELVAPRSHRRRRPPRGTCSSPAARRGPEHAAAARQTARRQLPTAPTAPAATRPPFKLTSRLCRAPGAPLPPLLSPAPPQRTCPPGPRRHLLPGRPSPLWLTQVGFRSFIVSRPGPPPASALGTPGRLRPGCLRGRAEPSGRSSTAAGHHGPPPRAALPAPSAGRSRLSAAPCPGAARAAAPAARPHPPLRLPAAPGNAGTRRLATA